MRNLKIGKLYRLVAKGKFYADSFIYACSDPHHEDNEDLGVSIEPGTIIVYLKDIKIKKFWLFAKTKEECLYYKILFNDRILFVYDDGWFDFEEITNESSL